jgi:hypothetical protein
MASLSNCPFKAFVNKLYPGRSNCQLKVYPMGKTAKLVSGNNKIKAGEELMWWYFEKYTYPSEF